MTSYTKTMMESLAEVRGLNEAFWKVSIPDMPPVFVEAPAAGRIRQDMKKKLKEGQV